MWEDSWPEDRLVIGSSPRTKGDFVGEDREKRAEEAEMREEDDDVEAHKRREGGAPEAAATEEGPDVEAHKRAAGH
jgi:hypothetical protein